MVETVARKKEWWERLRELPDSEDLGIYTAKSGRIRAKLKLQAEIDKDANTFVLGKENYVVDVDFSAYEEGINVRLNYKTNVFENIFARLKRAEAGLQELLVEEWSRTDWTASRGVMACIFSLENQTQHLYKERQEAARKRHSQVYGSQSS